MRRNIFLFIVALVATISCTRSQVVPLKDDPNVNKIFNKEEISDLNMIVKFFNDNLVKNKNGQDINQFYHEYFKKVNTSESLENLRTHIGLVNSNRLKKLIDKLKDKRIFHEIWKYSYQYKYKTNDTVSRRLSLNLQGKYFKLLELQGKNDNLIKQYYISIRNSGRINPSSVAIIMKRYKNVDFNLTINRLIWAVHYITILSEEPCTKKR